MNKEELLASRDKWLSMAIKLEADGKPMFEKAFQKALETEAMAYDLPTPTIKDELKKAA